MHYTSTHASTLGRCLIFRNVSVSQNCADTAHPAHQAYSPCRAQHPCKRPYVLSYPASSVLLKRFTPYRIASASEARSRIAVVPAPSAKRTRAPPLSSPGGSSASTNGRQVQAQEAGANGASCRKTLLASSYSLYPALAAVPAVGSSPLQFHYDSMPWPLRCGLRRNGLMQPSGLRCHQ